MKVVAVLYGGRSSEHAVSCRSAASIVAELDRSQYVPLLIAIDPLGVWYLQDEVRYEGEGETRSLAVQRKEASLVSALPSRGLFVAGRRLAIDIVFPVLHGSFGEDGTVQGLLELLDLAYVGAGVLGSSLAMDKSALKRLWQSDGLPVVPSVTVTRRDALDPVALGRIAVRAVGEFGFPLFAKPVNGGSSVGVTKVTDREGVVPAIRQALRFDDRALVERGIIGREIECSVTGIDDPVAYTPGEIVPTGDFYDYDAKYLRPDGARLAVPAELDPAKLEEVRNLALAAYRSAGIDGMARVDFLYEEGSSKLFLNEINTIPGFTNISMFARMCAASGLPFGPLLSRLIELGLGRHLARRSIERSR